MKVGDGNKTPAGQQARPAPKGGAAAAGKAGAKPAAKPSTSPMQLPISAQDAAVATILAREAYTRERHYMLSRVIMGMSVALCISLGLNVYQSAQPVQFRYFATDTSGAVRELVPLARPINTTSEVLTWLTNSVTQALTFDFVNYRQQFQAAQINFTRAGWQGFEKALQDSLIFDTVRNQKYVTTAVPTAAPVITAQGLIEGRYAWKIEIPILVTYQNDKDSKPQPLKVTAVVVRQSETEHPRGLGIAQIIAE